MTLDERKSKAAHYAVKDCSLKGIVKDVDTSSRVVTGFFNTYNFVDSDGDILLMGCAKASIKQRGPASQAVAKIKHAMFHDLNQLPGKIITLDEREIDGLSGIYFETRMSDTTLGNDTLMNYQDEIYDNHSIGFNYVWDKMKSIEVNTPQWDEMLSYLVNPKDLAARSIVFALKEIKLWEGSTVAFGSNSMTPFLGMAKSMKKESVVLALNERMNKLQTALKNGTQSDDMMEQFEVQFLQLKQMVSDLQEYIVIPDQRKDMVVPESGKGKIESYNGIDYNHLVSGLKNG